MLNDVSMVTTITLYLQGMTASARFVLVVFMTFSADVPVSPAQDPC